MAVPTSREEFIEYCLRKLGAPVINIDVTPEQIDDRVDEALSFFWDYHFDGSEKVYYKHEITQDDIDNKYITLPDNINGAVSIFPMSSMGFGADLFNVNYQFMMSEVWSLASGSLVPYYMAMENLALMQEILTSQAPVRYTRTKNKLYLDMNWTKAKLGEYLIVEAYEVVDPEIYADVWKDRWLLNYATALIQVNWGKNLTKFVGQQLVGNLQFNGERILDDGVRDRDALEIKIRSDFEIPPLDMVG